MKYLYSLISIILLMSSCSKSDDDNGNLQNSSLYFPPNTSNDWSRLTPEELGWDTSEINNLKDFLEASNTRAFIILKDGKIVIEEYFGTNITGTATFTEDTKWYWASAGKTLTSTLVGIAQQDGYLDIENRTSDYLGEGWTSLTSDQENLITIKNQLTMTTGLDYEVPNLDCTNPSCLNYKVDAGNQWFYHNAPYTLLEKVIENATGLDYNDYTNQKIESKIGMNGQWITQGYNKVYWSSARDMARFGLLILNNGKWNDQAIISNENYFSQMTSSSQNLNPSYGYLWWLNGKSSIIFPSIPTSFNTSLSEAAPSDLIAGMGKNGQFVEILPSQNIVVVRMGEASDGGLLPIIFHNEMWNKINLIFE
ncbi:serine hydrolase domain-containing protein [Psychroflexus aestuariivivens]|uniref:serine hydrolase domain-containing protein n=1 Tax=Psychroflexus aestuariivivens TaxID=1795040 RepID=UPI000FDC6862|nr:serine hydrolase domain-containing protein [Psychroflexus aestuariivivens]